MANPYEDNKTFPAVDVNDVLDPGSKKDFEVDPISAEVATTLEIKDIKERVNKAVQEEEEENNDVLRHLKSTIIVSAIVVAVAGAIFAITKKLREK
ncbi:uncharacterized protein LOC124911173 [Impatiens glandulifera]|uniref:uncharacterized protein LOC124911173 n=1 Tax=Impatiens glandulifera TaxID=253017 RepID=UPI001FB08AEC|nr:uncharacterized protein LOC124911173 [Impatiens glandulifera]